MRTRLHETQADNGESRKSHDGADGPIDVRAMSGDVDIRGFAVDGVTTIGGEGSVCHCVVD